MLHRVIRDHLDDFLRAAADRADGAGLPEFIAREFRKFLTCGVLAHGFARVRYERCAFEYLLPFSARSGARGPRHAHLDRFDLHAKLWVGPNDRARLEQLCRYVLRPPLAENRLRRQADGQLRFDLKRAWSDGTTHLLFEPLEFRGAPAPGAGLSEPARTPGATRSTGGLISGEHYTELQAGEKGPDARRRPKGRTRGVVLK